MGSGIALAALLADIPVMLYEPAPLVLERAAPYRGFQPETKAINLNFVYYRQPGSAGRLPGSSSHPGEAGA
jgi:hypothetical protein